MNIHTQTCGEILIVDPRADDYGVFYQSNDLHAVFRCLKSGEAALAELHQSTQTDWLVNLQLPDMTGIELLHLIRERRPTAFVILVGDHYSATDELLARSAGASAFLCKPVKSDWLAYCRDRASQAALHAGPMRAPN